MLTRHPAGRTAFMKPLCNREHRLRGLDPRRCNVDMPEQNEAPSTFVECQLWHQSTSSKQTVAKGGRLQCLECASAWFDDEDGERSTRKEEGGNRIGDRRLIEGNIRANSGVSITPVLGPSPSRQRGLGRRLKLTIAKSLALSEVSRREWLDEHLDAGAETPSITRLERKPLARRPAMELQARFHGVGVSAFG